MTDTQPTRTGLRARFASLLPPGHWAYILLQLVPLAIVDLLCTSMRITSATEDSDTRVGSWSWIAQLSSTVFFYLALIAFWVGVFALVRRRASRRIAVIVFHLVFTALALLVVLTQIYFILLDVTLNSESFELVKLIFQVNMLKIIQAELQSFLPVLAVVFIILANFFAVIVNRRWKPRRLRDDPPTGWRRAQSGPAVVASTSLVVIASLVVSALPNGQGTTNFSRNRVVSITMDSVTKRLDDKPDGFTAPTRADLPLDTRLVPTSRTKKYNVVQIVLESQGIQATSLGVPGLPTTPYLASLAKESLVANRAYTGMPHTTKSLVASNCGVAPPLDTSNSEAEPGGLAAKCLPTLLKEQGYATSFFQTATKNFENREKVVKGFGYDQFFPLEAFDKKGFSETNTLGYEDDLMLQPSLDWAAEQDGKPFAMEYMTLTAHSEYVLPEGWKMRHYVDDETHNHYLNAVAYQDQFVEQVIDGFKKLGLYDDTIFVIMGDHGEGFREHGRRLHNDTIWNEGIQIPYVIHAPEATGTQGKTVDAPVQNTATLQTVADLLGFDIVGGEYHASSILSPKDNERPLMTGCWDIDQCVAYFPDDRHKYIYFFGYKKPQYYDVVADPLEKKDLFETLSDAEAERLKQEVLVWQEEVNATHELSRRLADR
ncbi:sulfatase-like hydrolase/transferase [Aeromicrobium sp. NPDC092404]|uniref:LTA synthase family protein n=1 Tax=Aeromicrobium sp. NPDC092404 TaxID=3154976 RepID=UPI003449DC83